ncbi:MAG TPA: transglycosylase SLT domain-containing protein [Thermodesulfobacteriota bacterium]|nr:transglycosylase SLT domain-containing protein [Thermodesulfobacteriota bacterium]
MANHSLSGVVLKETFVKVKETCVKGRRRGVLLFVLMNLAYLIAIAGLSMIVVKQQRTISSFSCMEPVVEEYRTKEKLYGILRNKGYSFGQGLDIADAVFKRSQKLGLPVALIMAVIDQESEFYPHARSHKGAQGLMQITPLIWDEYVAKLNLKVDRMAIADPFMNITVGCQILKDLYDGYKHIKDEKVRMAKALTDYNNGPKSKDPNLKYAIGVTQKQDEYQKKLQGF